VETYEEYAWPPVFARLYSRNGLVLSLSMALGMAAFLIGFVIAHDPRVLFSSHLGPGAFYRLMPHQAMAWLFSLAFLFAMVAMIIGVVRFWRDAGGGRLRIVAVTRAAIDAARLRYLDGGGAGCVPEGSAQTSGSDPRKLYHHLTFYGMVCCFASTSVASLYHYFLGRQAPYPWWDLPVVLGTIGGIGLLLGPAGMLSMKWRRPPELQERSRRGMDIGFLSVLFLISLTGLALLLLRTTPAMPLLLAAHLGLVFSFFAIMPYTNMVHGLYRLAALVRYAQETAALQSPQSQAVDRNVQTVR
jgi:citrate/tricarballylate utilization protein